MRIFFPTRVSDVLRRLQEVFFFFPVPTLVFIEATDLIRLWFFIIPVFVSVNVQFELTTCDILSFVDLFIKKYSLFSFIRGEKKIQSPTLIFFY